MDEGVFVRKCVETLNSLRCTYPITSMNIDPILESMQPHFFVKTINLKVLNGCNYQFPFDIRKTVLELKQHAESLDGSTIQEQRIIFRGRPLSENSASLFVYIKDMQENTINLNLVRTKVLSRKDTGNSGDHNIFDTSILVKMLDTYKCVHNCPENDDCSNIIERLKEHIEKYQINN